MPPLAGQVRNELDRLAEGLHADGHEGPITAWDHRYYDDALRRTEFGVDQNRISEYFPLERVLEGMFEITRRGASGSSISSVPDAARLARIGAAVRDPRHGVRAVLAHFYADLFPREGKFGHAAAFPLVVGHRSRRWRAAITPVNAIVANFTPPSGDTPALLGTAR